MWLVMVAVPPPSPPRTSRASLVHDVLEASDRLTKAARRFPPLRRGIVATDDGAARRASAEGAARARRRRVAVDRSFIVRWCG